MRASRIKIRKATEADIPAIIAANDKGGALHQKLEPALFRRSPVWKRHLTRDLKKALGADRRQNGIFVADVDGAVAGYIWVEVTQRSACWSLRKRGFVGEMDVLPAYRRQGIGLLLFRNALHWFRSKKAKLLYTNYVIKNPSSTSFWKKMGFVPYVEFSQRSLK